jgi:TRAP-type C4-dicarboxylate transport system permease small subunit
VASPDRRPARRLEAAEFRRLKNQEAFMRSFLDGLYRVSGAISACFIVGITIIVFAQVLLNIVDRLSSLFTGSAIGLSIPSYADFTGFFLAAASFFALAYTLREGGHIRVTLFIQNTSPGIRRFIEFWCVGLAAAVTLYFAWYTTLLAMEAYEYDDLSSGMIPVPLWIPQSSMVAGLAVLSIALIDELFGMLSGAHPSYHDKGENLLEDQEPIPTSILDGE